LLGTNGGLAKEVGAPCESSVTKPRIVRGFVTTVAVVAVSLSACGGAGAASTPRAKVDRFDSARAFRILRAQVERFGHRPAGSAASRRTGDYLRPLLPGGRFEAVPGGLRNIVGVVPGTKPAIVIGAHYDTEALPEDFVGANDSAAGTAAVVELSRALRKLKRAKGAPELRFVLFDGEEEPANRDFFESGMRGSKAYVRKHKREVGAIVLLDYVANKGISFPREDGSDVKLWARLRAAAKRVGVAKAFPDRTAGEVVDDHTQFTDEGIPGIDLIDFSYRYRDTPQDTVDKTSADSLDVAGEAVYELIRTW
jgi:glutaminyl-peptide cyclotransferase